MKRALSSFAIIKNSFDEGEDYIGAFVPLLIRLFFIKNYTSVVIESICKDFEAEYGIRIPLHPMETILNRMKPKYLVKNAGRVTINVREIRKDAQKINFDEEYQKYDWLLNNFIAFCRGFQTPVLVSYEDSDRLFTGFLKEHDLDIIFAVYTEEKMSILPDEPTIDEPDKKYLINRYINMLMQQGGEHAQYLIDIAVGHNYASTILYREFSNIRGKGACANYYLDVGILFDLTGINREFRKKAAEDFIAMLKRKGSSLCVFRHNYDEFLQIIEGCLNWIDSRLYDPDKASRALQYFKDQGFTTAELQLFIANIPTVLQRNQIEIIGTPDPNIGQEFQIGREDLKRIILDVYNSDGRFFDLEEKEDTLERDIKSIESIYKLRRGAAPISLNDTSHVFVTSNSGLAYASTKFEQSEMSRGYFTIPTALTDIFVGTMIWTQEPAKIVEEYNRSKLIAYTNAAIHPRITLMKKFSQEVERARNNVLNPISNESAQLLLETSLARYLLSDKTLGDPNRISAQTPYEILKELEKHLAAKERAKAEEAIDKSEEDRKEREKVEQDLRNQTSNIQEFSTVVAKVIRWGFVGVFALVALLFYIRAEFQEPQSTTTHIINIVISVLGAVSGLSIWVLGKKIQALAFDKLMKMLVKSPPK